MIRPEELHSKRILISPLNWGMGHVSRCIGIIHQLLGQGNEVFIACDDNQQQVFSEYFKDITFISHVGYPFHFGGKGNFGWDLLMRSNSLRKRLKLEQKEVERYVKDYQIDCVLSDHRYGFISTAVPSIFITHQVNLPVRWYEKGVGALHAKLMKRFSFIWALDDDKSSLAGKLSVKCPENGGYIGHYSRFSLYDNDVPKTIDYVLVASGPELYAKQLIERVLSEPLRYPDVKIVHSTSLSVTNEVKGTWKEKDHVIRSAKHLISYSGYSTIMDCINLGVSATLSPTKGQMEQEYLAKKWENRKA